MKSSKRKWLSVCVALGLATATLPTWAKETVGAAVDDSVVTTRVKAALIENPATKARQIDVETDHGVVQLNGFVDSADEMAKAESVAKSVVGVTAVRNNLQLREGTRSAGNVIDDATVTARVKAALVADKEVKAYQVEVKTYKGVVSLGGFVSSQQQRLQAEKLAKGISGVVRVENGIALKKN